MRKSRLKIVGRSAIYHCVTRTVNKEYIIDRVAKEVLRKQLWQIADFSGVEVITYCIMSNHFHVLVKVPDRETAKVSDKELIRRYRVLYPKPTQYQQADPKLLEKKLLENDEEAEELRSRLLERMNDVSQFMKALKQRFSIWYNRTHDRVGTLWSERFKSTLVEGTEAALRITAAYIDLNPVRAKVVDDPKEYRWSGYGEAMGGSAIARQGICEGVRRAESGEIYWETAANEYRKLLYCKGVAPSLRGGGGTIPEEEWRKVMREGGKVPVAAALRCQVRYFTDGAVLGSEEYVARIFEEFRSQFGPKRRSGPRRMKGSDWEGLMVMRDLRKEVFG